MHIKSGDNVKVLSGKDRGKTGKVLEVMKNSNRAVVESINVMKKNVRPRREGEKGQIVEYNSPINISNLQLVCPKCNKAGRVRLSKSDKGEKIRTCSKCKASF